jgi:hypothetical protein
VSYLNTIHIKQADSLSNFGPDDESDFVIQCESRTFHVHRVILRRTDYFAALLSHNVKESQERKFVAQQDDHELFELMLHWIYGVDCRDIEDALFQSVRCGAGRLKTCETTLIKHLAAKDSSSSVVSTPSEAKFRCAVLHRYIEFCCLLDKYQMHDLLDALYSHVKEMAMDTGIWFHQDVLSTLELTCMRLLPSNKLDAVVDIRDSMLSGCITRLDMLRDEPAFVELLESNREIAKDLLYASTDPYRDPPPSGLDSTVRFCSACRSNERTSMVKGSGEWRACDTCGEFDTLTKRRERLWEYLDDAEHGADMAT